MQALSLGEEVLVLAAEAGLLPRRQGVGAALAGGHFQIALHAVALGQGVAGGADEADCGGTALDAIVGEAAHALRWAQHWGNIEVEQAGGAGCGPLTDIAALHT